MRSTCKVEQTGIIRHHNSAYFLQICRKNGQIISFSPRFTLSLPQKTVGRSVACALAYEESPGNTEHPTS